MGILEDIAKGLNELGDWATQHQRQRQQVWQHVAARRGGRYNPRQTGFLKARPASIDVPVRDIAVHVDTYVVSNKNSSTTYTRWRAGYLLPVGPVYRVFQDNIVSSIGTAIGFEDVVLGGHQAFDTKFVVRSADAVATRTAWTPSARDRMIRGFPAARVAADGHRVTLTNVGALRDATRLEVGIDLVAELAAYGYSWLDALRRLPGATWVTPKGPWNARNSPSVHLDVRGVTVWIYPALSGVGLTFCVSAALQREGLEPFEIEIAADGGLPDEGMPDDFLEAASMRRLPQVGACTLGYDGGWLRVVLHGELDESRIVAATHFIAEATLGTTARGVYR